MMARCNKAAAAAAVAATSAAGEPTLITDNDLECIINHVIQTAVDKSTLSESRACAALDEDSVVSVMESIAELDEGNSDSKMESM